MDLAAELADLPFDVATSPWDGHEVNIGYAVMNQPMSSGDLLGLRVFPRSDFGGYVSVWHRDPAGAWSQYVDRGPVAAGCPRVWGPALDHAGAATIEVDWVAPSQLVVRMPRPALRWRVSLSRTLPLRVLNAVHGRLPMATWRHPRLVALREWAVRLLGLGTVALSGTAPAGQHLTAALDRLYWVEASSAELDGRDLGGDVVLDTCPTIGGWPLPRRGVFAIGAAHDTIEDPEEYAALRRATVGPQAPSRDHPDG